MNNTIRWVVVASLLTGLLGLSYQVMSGFMVPVLWAVILVYVTWPLYRWVLRVNGKREALAALMMTLALASFVVVPVVWGTVVLQRETASFLRELPEWLAQKPQVPDFLLRIPYLGEELNRRLGDFDDLHSLVRARALPWVQALSNNVIGVAQGLGRNLVKFGLTALTMFFFYRDGAAMIGEVRRVLIHSLGQRANDYIATVESTVKAVVYGIVLTALGQGIIAGLGYWVVGLEAPILMTLVTIAFALIPFGTPFAWGGASLWLLIQDQQWAGVSLALWGVLVVSWVDNVIRPLVISANTQIPFLLVLFGVLGGLMSYGFIGLFVGPVILAVALAAWREWLATADEQLDQPTVGDSRTLSGNRASCDGNDS